MRKQSGNEQIMRSAVRLSRRSGRVEAGHAFAVAAGILSGMVVMCGTFGHFGQVLLHANHFVRMMVMGNNGNNQHENVDYKQYGYCHPLSPYHPAFIFMIRQRYDICLNLKSLFGLNLRKRPGLL